MNSRILVKVSRYDDGISFRTISREKKSPHGFYLLRSELERLWLNGFVVSNDLQSFAVFRYDRGKEIVSIKFCWLQSVLTDGLSGWEQTVHLPAGRLQEFLYSGNEECRSEQWKVLSLDKMKYPKLTFYSRNNLCAVLSQQVIRRKLLRFLRDHFRWPGVDEVRFYDDLLPYSFFFQEYCNGRQGICGGVILHNQQDWSRAYYSLHT